MGIGKDGLNILEVLLLSTPLNVFEQLPVDIHGVGSSAWRHDPCQAYGKVSGACTKVRNDISRFQAEGRNHALRLLPLIASWVFQRFDVRAS